MSGRLQVAGFDTETPQPLGIGFSDVFDACGSFRFGRDAMIFPAIRRPEGPLWRARLHLIARHPFLRPKFKTNVVAWRSQTPRCATLLGIFWLHWGIGGFRAKPIMARGVLAEQQIADASTRRPITTITTTTTTITIMNIVNNKSDGTRPQFVR